MRCALVLALLVAAPARAQPGRVFPAEREVEGEARAPAPELPGWIGELSGPRARADLAAADPRVRAAAAARLGRHGEPTRSVAALLARLAEEEDPRVRHAILEALARRGDRAAVRPIADVLAVWSAREDRAAGLRALGALGGERAIRALVDWLAAADVGDDAMLALVRVGPPAVPHLVRVLAVPLTSPRAATALGRIGDTRATHPLVSRLHGSVAGARLAMIRALAALGDERATPALARALRDADPATVAAALAALARVGGADRAPAVAALADRGTVEQRAAAIEALVVLDPAAAAPRVAAALRDEESAPLLRSAALEAMLAHPSEALQSTLTTALEVPAHRMAAAEALSRVPGDAAARALHAAARGDASRALDPALALAVRRGEASLDPGLVEAARAHLRADGSARGLVLAALARDGAVIERVAAGLAHEAPLERASAARAAELLGARAEPVRAAIGAALAAETDPVAFRALALAALRLDVAVDAASIDLRFWDGETAPEALWLAARAMPRATPRARARTRRAMRRALRAGQPRVRAGAALALALAADGGAARALVAALADDHDEVRLTVARALEVLAPAEAVPGIAAAARVERDERVWRALLDAARAVAGRPPPAFRRGDGVLHARVSAAPGVLAPGETLPVDVILADGRWLTTVALATGEVLVPDLPAGEAEVRVRIDR